MHLDIVLLAVLAALAVLTEIDKLWRRRNNERLKRVILLMAHARRNRM